MRAAARTSSPTTLAAGNPSIVCVPMEGKLVFCLETVAEEDEPLLAERIKTALA